MIDAQICFAIQRTRMSSQSILAWPALVSHLVSKAFMTVLVPYTLMDVANAHAHAKHHKIERVTTDLKIPVVQLQTSRDSLFRSYLTSSVQHSPA